MISICTTTGRTVNMAFEGSTRPKLGHRHINEWLVGESTSEQIYDWLAD